MTVMSFRTDNSAEMNCWGSLFNLCNSVISFKERVIFHL